MIILQCPSQAWDAALNLPNLMLVQIHKHPTILQLSLVLIRFCLLQASKNIYDILHCSQACGGIEVRYPFGLGAGCSLPGFQLSCIEDTLFIADTKDMQVLEILEGEIRMNSIGFTSQHFSAEANIFVAIGCNTEGFISSYDGNKGFECYATCNELHDLLDFSPNGCCQSSLPPVRKNIEFYVKILRDEEDVSHNMSCSYAFLAEEGRYNFTMSSVPGSRELANISLKLEWAVGESRCEEAIHSENYAMMVLKDVKASINIYDLLHCSQACGGIEVRYPFGLGAGCSLPGFQLSCIEDTLFITDTKDMQVLEILEGEIRMNSIGFTSQHFSAEANIFVAIGCNTEGSISSYDGNKGFECYTTCNELDELFNLAPNGYCQLSLPPVDVDECNDPTKRVCVLEATCENTIPGYACHCPLGSSGDGLIGRGCNRHLSVILLLRFVRRCGGKRSLSSTLINVDPKGPFIVTSIALNYKTNFWIEKEVIVAVCEVAVGSHAPMGEGWISGRSIDVGLVFADYV